MKTLLVLLMLGVMCAGIVMSGGQAAAQQYPQVAGLQPFSPSADYMSLPGYLRWQVFIEQGQWISYQEAAEQIAEMPGAPAASATSAAPVTGGIQRSGCPVTDVGAALGVTVFRGEASSSIGTGAGIEAVNSTGIGGKAGLKPQDVVVYANKVRTTCPRVLMQELSSSWGTEITLTVERAGKQIKIVLPAKAAASANPA